MTDLFSPNPKLSWPKYHEAYLEWMKRVEHPGLRDSNYAAQKFLENRKDFLGATPLTRTRR